MYNKSFIIKNVLDGKKNFGKLENIFVRFLYIPVKKWNQFGHFFSSEHKRKLPANNPTCKLKAD